MLGYIYCYTNKINGKKYVGQTVKTIAERAGKNGTGYKTEWLFWRAIKKYGWDAFSVEIIETFDKGLKETLAYVKSFFGNNSLAFAKKYFETVARLPEKCDFDILGHFDIITKNNEQHGFIDISSKEYLNAGFEAIHSLKGKIPFFEVNTGAISRGYKSLPYPQMEFLKEFRKCGFGAVITSDCHDKSFIDCHFEEAAELLLAAGFRSKWILTCNGFEEVSL
jgi:histidinol-phosphatase (PHP family)